MRTSFIFRSHLRIARTLLPLLAIVAVGCGIASSKTATVKGKVSFKGKNLHNGSVTFLAANGQSVSGVIDKEGNYTVERVPVGDTKVSVMTYDPPPMPNFKGHGFQGGPPKTAEVPADANMRDPRKSADSGPSIRLPNSVKDPESSGLTYTVKDGENTYDIAIK